jgi:copper homeostasis protein
MEFEDMKDTLKTLKTLGADGFVFGILRRPETRTRYGWIDIERNKELVQLADGKPCTFHRAFDLIPEPYWDTTLAELIACGFSSILTSGGSLGNQATDHTSALSRLHSRNHGLKSSEDLEIIIGGGVRSMNIQSLSQLTGGKSFHSSALVDGATVVSIEETNRMCEFLAMECIGKKEGPIGSF